MAKKIPFQGKSILLGVTGSIACYKAADLASKLAQAGANVDAILTQAALQFITPLTFQSVTGRRAYSDTDLWGQAGHVLHVGLGHTADLLVIAPASANTLAKLAHGLADNLLTVTALAAGCPLLIAPAMDVAMYQNPATLSNLETLRQRGAILIGPAEGRLASGLSGPGRMVEVEELLGHIRQVLGRNGPLKGRHVVVTAGGTQEPIDPVRYISNRSSGKQGYALAQAALDLGAQVTLVSGPTHLPTPVGAQRVNIATAEEMLSAVLEAIPRADALLMAAAVADFRPVQIASQKIKKDSGIDKILMRPTTDILGTLARMKAEGSFSDRWAPILVGFAAESQDLLQNARAKLEAKQLDLIAANDIRAVDSGFGSENNQVTLLSPHDPPQELPLMSKEEVAQVILERVISLIQAREQANPPAGK